MKVKTEVKAGEYETVAVTADILLTGGGFNPQTGNPIIIR